MLLAANKPADALTLVVSLGLRDPLSTRVVCTSAQRLGLRKALLASFVDCTGINMAKVSRSVQSFEQGGDSSLTFSGDFSQADLVHREPTNQSRIVGGHGKTFADSYTLGKADTAVGEIVWTTTGTGGSRFGALLGAGNGTPETMVFVERKEGAAWQEIGRIVVGTNAEVLAPSIVTLSEPAIGIVRVRILDNAKGPWGHVLADALTFFNAE